MGTHQPIRKVVAPEIPDKLYFRIGDVAELCQVPAYVLRFWETEFKQLKPNKGGTGQRLYRRKDVEMALRIKSLLYDQGYTIPGARQVFLAEAKAKESAAFTAAEPAADDAPTPFPARAVPPERSGLDIRREALLRELRGDLQALHAELSQPLPVTFVPVEDAPTPKVKPMRPRLVVETKSEAMHEVRPGPRVLKPEPVARPKLQQGDLFGFPAADDDPYDDGPIAS